MLASHAHFYEASTLIDEKPFYGPSYQAAVLAMTISMRSCKLDQCSPIVSWPRHRSKIVNISAVGFGIACHLVMARLLYEYRPQS